MLLYVDNHYRSPYAMSVFVALREKHIAFEMRTVDFESGENHTDAYSTASLTERVPTLVIGDFSLSESSAITEYLDEIFPGTALYPPEPKAKARARQVQAWIRSDFLPIRQERSTICIYYQKSYVPLSQEAQNAAHKLFRAADALLEHNGENLFGAWSIADVDLALMLNRLVLNGDDVPDRLAEYARTQ